jgi:hypothetical protein
VRRRLAWIGGALGLAALVRGLRRRQREALAPPAPAPASDDPAQELRAALAETKAEEPEPGQTAERPASLEERRRQVHERAQEALDAMKDPPAGA